jgi:hypothetical protein
LLAACGTTVGGRSILAQEFIKKMILISKRNGPKKNPADVMRGSKD